MQRGTRYPLMAHYEFQPNELPGCKIWTPFNQGITVTGSGVSQWDDLSGNGNHLKQGTDLDRPQKQADGSILTDGIRQFLKADAFTLEQPETIYLLGQQVSWQNGAAVFDGNAVNGGKLAQLGTTPTISQYAGASGSDNNDWTVGADAVVVAIYNGASSVLQINNGTPVVSNTGTGDLGGFIIGIRGDLLGNFSNIQVKEVVVFSEAHDAQNRKQMAGYLARVGGLKI